MSTSVHTSDAMARRVAQRRAAESRFRAYGIIAIALAIAALAALFISIIGNGYTAFQQTFIELEVTYDSAVLGIGEDRDSKALSAANYPALVNEDDAGLVPGREGTQGQAHPVRHREHRRELRPARTGVLADPGLIGRTERIWVPADDDVDMLVKGHIDRTAPESEWRVKDNQLGWVA